MCNAKHIQIVLKKLNFNIMKDALNYLVQPQQQEQPWQFYYISWVKNWGKGQTKRNHLSSFVGNNNWITLYCKSLKGGLTRWIWIALNKGFKFKYDDIKEANWP